MRVMGYGGGGRWEPNRIQHSDSNFDQIMSQKVAEPNSLYKLEQKSKMKREVDQKIMELKAMSREDMASYKTLALTELGMREQGVKSTFEIDKNNLDSHYKEKLEHEKEFIKTDYQVKISMEKSRIHGNIPFHTPLLNLTYFHI